MTIIICEKVKNKAKALNKKFLRKYWDILYPRGYSNIMTAKKKK